MRREGHDRHFNNRLEMTMHHRMLRRWICASLGVAMVATLVGGCGSSNDDDAASVQSTERTFVGAVESSDAFIAVVVDDTQVLAYLCDSDKLWDYLTGSRNGDTLAAEDVLGEVVLTATLTGDSVGGAVTLPDGGSHDFTATLATGDAGAFGLERRDGDIVHQGGWIRLADGQVRGKAIAVDVAAGADVSLSTQPGDPVGDGSGTGTAVPPDAVPMSFLGLAACGVAGARVAVAQNRFNRNPDAINASALAEAQKRANQACGPGAAA
jgi:hypothetical protein